MPQSHNCFEMRFVPIQHRFLLLQINKDEFYLRNACTFTHLKNMQYSLNVD